MDSYPIEDAVKVYRAKANYDKGESYALGIQRLVLDPTFAHNLTPEQLETIQSKYGLWETPSTTSQTKLRWPNAKKRRAASPPAIRLPHPKARPITSSVV